MILFGPEAEIKIFKNIFAIKQKLDYLLSNNSQHRKMINYYETETFIDSTGFDDLLGLLGM
jgi:hypothetical protein